MMSDVPTYRLGTCKHCRLPIAEVRDSDSGEAEWYTHGGDFGCEDSPLTHLSPRGSHEPEPRPAIVAIVLPFDPCPTQDDPSDPFSLPENIP